MLHKKLLTILLLSFIPALLFSLSDAEFEKLMKLNRKLVEKGVADSWLYDTMKESEFRLHTNIGNYFHNMAEHRVERKERSFNWYKNHFGLDLKIAMGKGFLERNIKTLRAVEEKNGLPYELVAAIIGMETNFADRRGKGSFYVFNTLVSQYLYVPKRERFAINQLAALYNFSQKTERPVYYFIGSFAGASGWAQFIPSSFLHFFVDSAGSDHDIDIYSVEDCLFSIENYLFMDGAGKLKADMIEDEEALYRAVYSYNRSDAYVKAVLYIYQGLREMRERFDIEY